MPEDKKIRIGIVATHVSGTDGVSLETNKWVDVLIRMGHECFFFCGEADSQENRKVTLVAEAHHMHPEIMEINEALFIEKKRSQNTETAIYNIKNHLKTKLFEFCQKFELDLIIAENVLSLPMNLPLGLAFAEFIGQTSMSAIAHHHDFWWERNRYMATPAEDYLHAAFPCTIKSIMHVVINSVAAKQLAFRKGVNSVVIPNIMDFDSPPAAPDGYADDMRNELAIEKDAYFLLQPTRIVPRKKIEKAIELVRRMDSKCVLVVTHDAGDEGFSYQTYLEQFAKLMGVKILFASDRFDYQRKAKSQGRKVYSLSDAYLEADLVTYASSMEGFGNAFLETIYYRKPLVIEAYEIFKLDIQPKGFKVIAFEDFIDRNVTMKVLNLLEKQDKLTVWADKNYRLGRRYFSYRTLEKNLSMILGQIIRN
jgi:glycosyltransferase involved in cell wall biosynthesis